MTLDWEKINEDWGAIMKMARTNEQMHQNLDYDDEGRVLTANRPMIESMICAKAERKVKIQYYLQMLGYRARKGRIIEVSVGTKMPFRTGGRGKKVKK
jgi:hypothetical protein